jgi:hypothetical protein
MAEILKNRCNVEIPISAQHIIEIGISTWLIQVLYVVLK